MTNDAQNISILATTDLMVVFADLTGYTAMARRAEGLEALAVLMGELYERIAAHTTSAGGRVVKFIGDAALIVFPESAVDAGVRGMLALKQETDSWLAAQGIRSTLVVKAHFGAVMAGAFGGKGDKRFDVLGPVVNIAATLDATSFALSPQVFRKLGPQTRQLFRKHTPPMTYVPLDAA